jgi:RNA polymerase sigma-B factor
MANRQKTSGFGHTNLTHHVDGTELFHRWQRERDFGAREQLVHMHLGLARRLASRYARTQEPLEDLIQVASLGLVKAIDRFDADRGVAFATFAVPTILGELKRHFRDTGWSLHVPRKLQELVLKVQEGQATLSSRTGRSPTVLELAEYLELPSEEVVEALEAMGAHHAGSLDAPIDGRSEEGTISQHDAIGFEDASYARFESSASLAAAVSELSEADQTVLALRFRQELTQREIAGRIGVSQMQVSRILRRIGKELREAMSV